MHSNEFTRDGQVYSFITKNKKVKYLFDAKDFHKIAPFYWITDSMGYAVSPKTKKRIHQIILGHKGKLVIDHINGDVSDNRKSNLQFISRANNVRKGKHRRNNTSGFKGVRRIQLLSGEIRFVARIKNRLKNIHIGTYSTIEAAAVAYNEAAIKCFGKFVVLNKLK